MEISKEVRAALRAAVDLRFGEGTSAMLDDLSAGVTQAAMAVRFGVSDAAISQRKKRAKAYTLKLLEVMAKAS